MPEPFYFGPAQCRLFGVYHPPLTTVDRDVAVLICAPFGREYLRSHRGLRQLAVRLAQTGHHVLRFDYRGCGDSAGEPTEAGLDDWKTDVDRAADELMDRTGLSRLTLIGLRLGGTMALLAAGGRREVEGLVLWEPILDGGAFLTDLLAMDRAWHVDVGLALEEALPDGSIPVLGFPLGQQMQRDLESLVVAPVRRPARRFLLLRDQEAPADGQLAEVLGKLGVTVERVRTPEQRIWMQGEEVDRALVPSATFQRIVTWLVGEPA